MSKAKKEPTAREVMTAAIKRAKAEQWSVRFLHVWRCLGGPVLVQEHRFHAERKWRFDFALVEERIAIELDGGVFSAGRHTRAGGFLGDLEKQNAAVLAGWRVLRLGTGMVTREHVEPMVAFVRRAMQKVD